MEALEEVEMLAAKALAARGVVAAEAVEAPAKKLLKVGALAVEGKKAAIELVMEWALEWALHALAVAGGAVAFWWHHLHQAS